MTMLDIATTVQRVKNVLQQRPDFGLHDDAPAEAHWVDRLRTVSSHANGTQVVTDMPVELGGGGGHVTPGWLFRASIASCLATRIVMSAAAEGLALEILEVRATSRSDLRGLLGMVDKQGEAVPAGPLDLQIHVRIAVAGTSPDRLRALVEESQRTSPMCHALEHAIPICLKLHIGNL